MTYVLAGSLGAVGIIPLDDQNVSAPEFESADDVNPSDAEALGDHMVRAFEQARAAVQ